MKVLLIEDNQLLAKFLIKGLKKEKILVEHFPRGDDGARFLENHFKEIDIVILDLMLPGLSGEEICKEAREKNIDTPILILSAKDSLESKVEVLNIGADDYLTKPFEFDELLARIKALTRRKVKTFQKNIINISPSVHIDLQKRVVYKDNIEQKISPKEFSVLEVLLKYRGKAISRSKIFNEINDFADIPWSNSIDVYIKNLRKKLFYNEKDIIKTIRGTGYRID